MDISSRSFTRLPRWTMSPAYTRDARVSKPQITAAWIAQQPELSDIAANRQTTLQIKIKGEDDNSEDGETTTTIKGGRSTSKNRSIKYVCHKCGCIIRATKEVNVVCGDCDIAFEIAK